MDALGDMFRYAVQNSMERVKVTDEKDHVEMYLLIQRYRNRIMPKIVWESEGFEDYRILRLTLQPLIENAFKHGFAGGVEPHHEIRIRFKKKGGVLSVEVEDNGSGSAEDVCETHFINENKGVGLYNVHRRLQLAYGEKYGLTLKGDKGRGMIVRMHIPIHDKKTEDISF